LRKALLLALALACFVPSGCEYLESREIEAALGRRAQAASRGDAEAYLDFFATGYKSEWIKAEELFKKAAERLSAGPPSSLSFGKFDIIIKGDKALVTESFILEDSTGGKPRRWAETQHLRMRKRGDEWVCVRGSKVLELLGGRMEEEAAIEQALLKREAALVKRDITSYMDLLAEDYSFRGEGPEDVKEKVMRNFRIYDNMHFRTYDRKIWFFGRYATVEQRFSIDAQRLGEPVSLSGRERFEMKRTRQGWKFIKGL